jgi:hypothetical protein
MYRLLKESDENVGVRLTSGPGLRGRGHFRCAGEKDVRVGSMVVWRRRYDGSGEGVRALGRRNGDSPLMTKVAVVIIVTGYPEL